MDKFDECYKISAQIIDKYLDLIYFSIYSTSDLMYKAMLGIIKKLVREEYNIVHSMSFDEVEEYLLRTETIRKYYNDRVIVRIRNKLLNYREVLLGKGISCEELGITDTFNDMNFSVSDAIVSMIDIDVIKNMRAKIFALVPNCKSDKEFVDSLKEELENSKIDLLYSVSFAEIFALYMNSDINKIPRINMNKINTKIRMMKIYDSTEIVNYAVTFYAKEILNNLSKIKTINNNPKDVYFYLIDVTRMEVLSSYMDRKTLNSVYDYCCSMINSNNVPSMTNVKRLIKRRMKECE